MKNRASEGSSIDQVTAALGSKKSERNKAASGRISGLNRLPDHGLSLSIDGNLEINWRGHAVGEISKEVAPWHRLHVIDEGFSRLAQYLDEKVSQNGLDSSGKPNVPYKDVAARWTKRASIEYRDNIQKSSNIKADETIYEKLTRENKEKIASDIKEEIVYFLMSEFSSNLIYSKFPNAEEIATSLNEIALFLDRAYANQSVSVRGKAFAEALQFTLSALKDDVTERNTPRPVLPERAVVNYMPRKSGRASVFLEENYGTYIDEGVCFRPDIRRLDPKLEMALRNEFRGRPESLRAILPNKEDEVSSRLETAFGQPVPPEKRKLAMQALTLAKAVNAPK